MGALHDCLQTALADWTSPSPYSDRKALAAYMPVHLARIRSLVPPDNLIEFHSRDGWEPLSKFLGKDVPPNEPFPSINKGRYAPNLIRVAITIKLIKMSFPYLVVLGAALAAWQWGIRK
jgi:hypothetical protein